jgi:hypothetical protein
MDAIDHLDLVVSDVGVSLAFYRSLLRPLVYVRESVIAGEHGERVTYLNRVGGGGSVSPTASSSRSSITPRIMTSSLGSKSFRNASPIRKPVPGISDASHYADDQANTPAQSREAVAPEDEPAGRSPSLHDGVDWLRRQTDQPGEIPASSTTPARSVADAIEQHHHHHDHKHDHGHRHERERR